MPSILDLAKSCEVRYQSRPTLIDRHQSQRSQSGQELSYNTLQASLPLYLFTQILIFALSISRRIIVHESNPIYQEPLEWS